MRKNFCPLLLLFMTAFARPSLAWCASGDEERHAGNFYSWYISTPSRSAYSDGIHAYVCSSTVRYVRMCYEEGVLDSDYFTKSQDVWGEWLDSMVVHPSVKLDETISIVPVSFTPGEGKRHHLVVFMRNDADGLCITKVSGAQHIVE